ncbi:MAG: prolipoprotein diacylglyceryl transferase [Abditibacteriaceae bacterium]
MHPVLFIVPTLPQGWFMPLAIVVAVVAIVIAGIVMSRSHEQNAVDTMLLPLGIGAAGVVLLWMWTRHSLSLHSYGLLLVIGFFAATLSAAKEAKRRGYDPNLILDMALPMLIVTILTCRILYVMLAHDQFHSFWEMLRVWDGGLSFYGAFIGGPLVFAYFAWSRKMSVLVLSDLVTPSVFLGYFFGRIGCLLNGCCYGRACSLPWAIQFPTEGNPSVLTPPSHPTQLYSALIALALFFVMQRAKVGKRFTQFAGQISLLFVVLYLLERSFVEIFRLGATAEVMFPSIPWLSQAQFASALILIVVAVAWKVLSAQASQNVNLNTTEIDRKNAVSRIT